MCQYECNVERQLCKGSILDKCESDSDCTNNLPCFGGICNPEPEGFSFGYILAAVILSGILLIGFLTAWIQHVMNVKEFKKRQKLMKFEENELEGNTELDMLLR